MSSEFVEHPVWLLPIFFTSYSNLLHFFGLTTLFFTPSFALISIIWKSFSTKFALI